MPAHRKLPLLCLVACLHASSLSLSSAQDECDQDQDKLFVDVAFGIKCMDPLNDTSAKFPDYVDQDWYAFVTFKSKEPCEDSLPACSDDSFGEVEKCCQDNRALLYPSWLENPPQKTMFYNSGYGKDRGTKYIPLNSTSLPSEFLVFGDQVSEGQGGSGGGLAAAGWRRAVDGDGDDDG